jgi:hypothetical protein
VQIAAFCVSAVVGGTMFLQWWRMEEEDRPRVWLLYGWFSGLMCLGSVFGVVTWAAWMQYLVTIFIFYGTPGLTPAQAQSLFAHAQYWAATFYVTYAIEFLCLSVAKLLVLHRMADFAVAKGDGMRRRWAVGGRVVMAVVVVGNVAGLCANVPAAVYMKEAGDFNVAAAAAYSTNNTDAGNNISNQAFQKITVASDASSVQNCCEVAVLLIIIIAFAVVGIASARRVSSALRNMNDQHVEATGRQLRRQIVGTAAFVFVTFLLRAVFSITNALANALQNDDAACVSFCDVPCNNMYQLIQNWLLLTPEFQLSVVLISSPLALLVALWGMTSKHTLQHMKSGRRQMETVTLRTK